MKICFVCSEYPPVLHGGIGTLTQVLARGLTSAGHEVRVVGVYDPEHAAPDYEEDQGVRVWRLRRSRARLGWIRDRFRLFKVIAAWARSHDIDLVEVPDWEGWAAGWPQMRVPVIARMSGSSSYFRVEMGKKVAPIVFWLERSSLHRADFTCSESKYLAGKTQQIFNLPAEPDAIIYNPVEVCASSQKMERIRNRVVFAGTLTAKKGVMSLVECWPRVRASCKDAELHIWGKDGSTDEGSSMSDLLQSKLNNGAAGSVYFHGQVPLDQLLMVFDTARVVVLPSYAEGFALTPLHSMAAGCPTIYTRRGSGPELIQHGQNGLLVDPDKPDEIADAIIAVLKDDNLAGRLGEAGRRQIEESFSLQTLLHQNEELYRTCTRRFAGETNSMEKSGG